MTHKKPKRTIYETMHNLNLTETEALNILQDNGRISDNAITMRDVPQDDLNKAAEWLEIWHRKQL